MGNCIVCGELTDKPMLSALSHFRLYQSGQWEWWQGNIKTFGFWDGLDASLGITFPIYSTIKNWKYRKYKMTFNDDIYQDLLGSMEGCF